MKQQLLKSLRLRVAMLTAMLCGLLGGASQAWGETATWSGATALPGEFTSIASSPINIKVSTTNTYTNPIRVYANTTITIQANTGYVIQSVTYEASSTGNYVTYAQNATVTPQYSGQPTVSSKNVTWSFGNNSEETEFTFTPSSQTRCNSISVTYKSVGGVEKADPEISFNPTSVEITQGESLPTISFVNPHSVTGVTFTSNKESVATVDNNGVITLGTAYGTATITASYSGDDTYSAASATCVIKVNDRLTWPTLQWQDEDLLKVTSMSVTYGAAFTAPTVYYTGDGTKTFSSSVETVATIDGTGQISIVGPGTTEIKVETSETETYHSTSATFTLNVLEAVTGEEFELLTDASTLVAGDRIVITNTGSSVAMSTTQNNNNRGEVAVALQNGKIVVPSTGSTIQVLTLEGSSAGWYFNTGAGYLAAVSSSSNNLHTITTTPLPDNAKATISISDDVATITFQGNYTRNSLRYNSSNNIFSCYASGQQAVKIYRKADERTDVTLSFTGVPEIITKGTTATYTATANPSVTGITYESNSENVTVNASTGEITAVTVGEATITASFAGDATHKPATASYTIEVVPAQHTAKFFIDDEEQTEAEAQVNEGAAITFPTAPETISEKTFVGWTTAAIDDETDEAPVLVTSATMGTADVTYYAVYATLESEGEATTITDVLTQETTGVTGSSYTDWSGKTATSSAVYAGQSAGSNESIQIRSKNSDSGIVTTTSGGKISKVVVEWNSGTADGRTLNVYGSNTAYTAASDLYSDETSGTLLGTIVNGTSTELNITGDYAFIGLRSAESAMYLTSVSITWQNGVSATYSGYCTTVPAVYAVIGVGSTGFATFSYDKALDFTDVENIYAYTATVNGKEISFTRVYNKVPANTGLLLRAPASDGENDVLAQVPVIASATEIENNALVAVSAEIASLPSENSDGSKNYILNKPSGKNVGFFLAADKKVGAGKAYLKVPAGVSAVKSFAEIFGGETDGVEEMTNDKLEMTNIFNLAGQRLQKLQKGVNIVGGKKVLVK